MKILSISIVLYKTSSSQLKKCINSLQVVEKLADLYLIDNSPSKELKKLETLFKNTKYIFLQSNQGYARGHNKAMEIVLSKNYKYHLVLNPDCYFNGNIILELIKVMNRNENIGLIMPKVLNPDGTIQNLYKFIPKPSDLILTFILKSIKLDSIFKSNHIISGDIHNKPSFIPYLSGCFMFMRLSALRNVGLFDNKFFMYAEDIDLSRRISEKYLTIYFPFLYIYHEHGKGSYKSLKLFIIHVKNLLIYFNKWGWFFDKKRVEINQRAINFNKNNYIY